MTISLSIWFILLFALSVYTTYTLFFIEKESKFVKLEFAKFDHGKLAALVNNELEKSLYFREKDGVYYARKSASLSSWGEIIEIELKGNILVVSSKFIWKHQVVPMKINNRNIAKISNLIGAS